MKATYINHYLTDNDVANFARQSFANFSKQYSEADNHKLIRFLARGMSSGDWSDFLRDGIDLETEGDVQNFAALARKIPEHWVPFGHPQISIQVSAPVPIARQLFKHKIGFVESEESRRYIKSEPVLFIPHTFREAAASVKQGSAGDHPLSNGWKKVYEKTCRDSMTLYQHMIADGICPEQARFVLPQGVEVNWVWTGSLYAYANMYNQRSDSHAQKETQIIAEQINDIISPLFPVSWAALTQADY